VNVTTESRLREIAEAFVANEKRKTGNKTSRRHQ